MAGDRLAYSMTELARLVGVSRPTIYKWSELPGFPKFRVDGLIRVPKRAFEEWMDSRIGGTES